MNKHTFAIAFISFYLAANSAFSVEPIKFMFESDTAGWEIPDWAESQKDCVGKFAQVSSAFSHNKSGKSLEIMANFPGNNWTQAIVEKKLDRDLTGYKEITAYVYAPKNAPTGFLQARVILTVGSWYFVESKSVTPLNKGKWVKVSAKLDVDDKNQSTYWKYSTKKEGMGLVENIDRIRKVAIRVEYNASTKNYGSPYKGPVYIDDITIE